MLVARTMIVGGVFEFISTDFHVVVASAIAVDVATVVVDASFDNRLAFNFGITNGAMSGTSVNSATAIFKITDSFVNFLRQELFSFSSSRLFD